MGGGGQRPFYHLLKMPFGAVSGVARLDAAHVFGGCLQCVSDPRNVTCDTNATCFKQSQPPDSIMSFINLDLFHKRTRVRGIHVCLSAGM